MDQSDNQLINQFICQGRSDGGYIGIYTPPKQSTLQIFMWLLVVFFSLRPRTNSISCQCVP